MATPRFTATRARVLLARAHMAGMAAGAAKVPTPMVVGTPRNPLVDGVGGDFEPGEPIYYVPSGVCGFAWIVIRPGGSSLARHAVKFAGASAHYGGGVSIWVREFGQSMERKAAYAAAFAGVLQAAGVRAHADSRMD